ncbi:MAG: hypothetical protein LBB90_04140 [Tannerella sp.]|nr:hypothetical protein [Tannerella sp.]
MSGSQDSLGIVYPGLNRLYYRGDYWPESIESVDNPELLKWIEERIWLIPLFPRLATYDVLVDTRVTPDGVVRLSKAADDCWQALLSKDVATWGKAFSASFDAQIAMFPNMVTPEILCVLEKYRADVYGWKLSGAGGGGYFVFVSEQPVPNGIQIRIRR